MTRLSNRSSVMLAGIAVAGVYLLAPQLGASSDQATKRSPFPFATQSKTSSAKLSAAASSRRAMLDQYCVACHNERMKQNFAGLALDSIDAANVSDRLDVWENVVRKVRTGLMPPAGRPRPSGATQKAFIAGLETDLDQVAEAHPNPGRTEAFHRLNRAEYQNVVRDLLAVDADVASLLPIDDASYGFDNIAASLKINQSQMEQYLSAARKISRAALGSALPAPAVQEFRAPETLSQYEHIEGLPFGTRGGLLANYSFPQNGEYEIAVDLLCRIQGECDGSAGFGDQHQLEVTLDGERIKLFVLEPRSQYRPPAERVWRVRVTVTAGPHDIGVAFIKLPSIREADAPIERFLRPQYLTGNVAQPQQTIYQPFVDRVTITGPFNGQAGTDTPSRRALLVCRPKTAADEPACARTILERLARRAFRRPVTAADVAPLLRVFQEGRSGGDFEAGIEAAVRRLLVSPEFLFRVERDAAATPPNTNYRISDLELASRLSFFLWSSIPDEELSRVAVLGKLRAPGVLEQQVRRMLADRRSSALVSNFAGQWLQLRNLDVARPDPVLFPNFDDGVRLAFRRETELFVESILREDRGVMELLTADYTFVNERLARHYGIRNVYGDQFRRITLSDPNRRGILGQGSILLVTSRPNRTSPVLRGKWILSNVLGVPPPEPPVDVPALEEDKVGNHNQVQTMRQRLSSHRSNPACSGCHSMIDPPGFALENFDAVGRWREIDEARAPIDASGQLLDGTRFDGFAGFRATLLREPEQFVTTVTEKLMMYALGRGIEPYDMPAIRRIVRRAAPSHKLSAVILGIAQSTPFQMRRSAGAPGTVARLSEGPAPLRPTFRQQ